VKKLPVTVIILTLNEEDNLAGAIESVKDWTQEVFIVDSLSSDRTVDVALEQEVNIVQHPFTSYGDQWRWALEHLPIRTPWILKLDADERVSPSLAKEFRDCLENNPKEDGFIVRIRLWFFGKPLHAEVRICRLWRKDKGQFSDVIVNEHLHINGSVGRFKGFIEHFDSINLHRWYEKQNHYTTMEAIMRVKGEHFAAKPKLFGRALEQRMFFKKHFYHIPFRYQVQWLYEAIWRRALLDGLTGLAWVQLRIEVQRAIELKVRQMRVTGNILELPKASMTKFDPRVLSSRLQKLVSTKNIERKTER
jgi:glycosyltransferase involved in cell wall biosynthesis